jgi:hypothetical protein
MLGQILSIQIFFSLAVLVWGRRWVLVGGDPHWGCGALADVAVPRALLLWGAGSGRCCMLFFFGGG